MLSICVSSCFRFTIFYVKWAMVAWSLVFCARKNTRSSVSLASMSSFRRVCVISESLKRLLSFWMSSSWKR